MKSITKQKKDAETDEGEEPVKFKDVNAELMKQVENVVKQAVEEENIILGDDSYKRPGLRLDVH